MFSGEMGRGRGSTLPPVLLGAQRGSSLEFWLGPAPSQDRARLKATSGCPSCWFPHLPAWSRLGQAPLPTAQGLAGNLPIGMTLLEGLCPFSARPSQEIVTFDLDPIAGALRWADGPSGKGVEKSQVVMDVKPITPLSRSVVLSHPLWFSRGGLNGPIIVHIFLPPAWTPRCHLLPPRPCSYARHACCVTCCFTWSPNAGRFSTPYSCWLSECVCQFRPLPPVPSCEETHQKPVACSALGSVVDPSHPLFMEFVPHTCQRSITSPISGDGGTYRSKMT